MAYEFHFEKEYYSCLECGKKLEFKDVNQTWKCPICDGNIVIHAKNGEENTVVLRKCVGEISEGDGVLMYLNYHTVLANTFKNGKYNMTLKGYGVIKASESDWFNCPWGRWDGNETKL